MDDEETMKKPLKRIAITGGAGQIAYSLLFRLASGELFGKEQPLALHILELPHSLQALQGVEMELQDCAYPALKEIRIGTDPYEMFKEIDLAILIGAKPRTKGMERKDLLKDNGKIFAMQGKALNEVAKKEVKVFVVGNPCNTNCLIAMHSAPSIAPTQFYAMTRLDQNRARFQLAKKVDQEVDQVDNVVIWGNHSSTQVPDFINARIGGRPLLETLKERKWLEEAFFSTIQKRGAQVIEARGKSSAASAANAVLDGLKDLYFPTPKGHYYSCCCLSDDNPYHIKEGLIFSFPCRTNHEGKMQIVEGLELDTFLKQKIALSEQELMEERDLVAHLLN